MEQFQKTLEIDANFRPAHMKFSQLYAQTGKFAEAEKEWRKYHPTNEKVSEDAKGYGQLVVTTLREEEKASGYVPAAFFAFGYAAAGDREKTFELLEKGMRERDDQIPFYIRYPIFDPYRSDPRYTAILQATRIAAIGERVYCCPSA